MYGALSVRLSEGFLVLDINYCNSFSSLNHIQVLIQRREIKKMKQPGSHKKLFICDLMLPNKRG